MFIDKYGYPAKLRGGKGGTLHRFYEMSYGQASRTLNAYLNGSKRVKGDESLRVSLYLDNAMRGNLHIFVIDFDRFDENSGFFQSAKSLTDKVAFATDDIYRLGGSQRAKLQYHILAQHFPLVHVDEQDKADLEAFAAQADTGAAQLWLARMHWPQGHEKMVTFGQNIGVPGNVKGLWCYKAELDAARAVYTGCPMTWELRAVPILQYLTLRREPGTAAALEVIQTVMRLLYYQNGLYLTVPGDMRRTIVKWAYQYLKDRTAPFPFAGDMGSDSCQFTINFQRDTALKENINIHADMGAYNAAHNAEKAARRTAKRFADLTGERWTTAELHAQSFTDRNIKTFCKDGLIKKLYQGHYQRVFV